MQRLTGLRVLVAGVLVLCSASTTLAKQPASGPHEGPGPEIYTKDNAPATPKLEDLPKQRSVTQYGITWTFEEEASVGRFITGDYYVVGPVTVVAIDPDRRRTTSHVSREKRRIRENQI